MMRVDGGALGTAFTIETANSLSEPTSWTPLYSTTPPALPFEFTDFDVVAPQKFYQARQP